MTHLATKEALKRVRARLNPEDGTYLGKVMKAAKPKAIFPFESFMDENGKAVFKIASSLHTSRLSAFGFTAEAKYLGYTEYQVNEQLDGRTCPVCRLMHGKVFKIADARNLLNTVIRTKDPSILKALQPWPKQNKANLESMALMTGPEFVTRGWHVPPYHPMCRGLLSKATVKIPLPDIGQPIEDLPEVAQATAEDFEQLDVKLSPSKVAQWNTLMQTPPAEVIAKLSGTTPDSLLASIQGAQNPKGLLGLVNLSVTSTGVNVELKTKIKDSLHAIVQDLYFRKDKSLFVGLVEFHPQDTKYFKEVMRNMYGLATATSMERISLVTGEGLGGYAFAKYGFSLNKRQWATLKLQIQSKMAKEKVVFPAVEQKALSLILASDDPNNIWALADLPMAGKTLLDGITWPASLDLSDQEALTRFLAYLG